MGRQEEPDKTSPSTTTTTTAITSSSPAPVERYDLTSYGDYDDSQAPSLSYGAPPPEQDIQDVYVGDIPADGAVILAEEDNLDSGIFDNYDDDLVVPAASDTGKGGEDDEEEKDGDEGDDEVEGSGSSSRSDEVPAWCDPTHPMGAWLNYFNIQVTSQPSQSQ